MINGSSLMCDIERNYTFPSIASVFCFFLLIVYGTFAQSPEEGKEEIKWDAAASEVDSFPFSKQFIDSVCTVHKVRFPKEPLRTLSTTMAFVPETLVYTVGWGPFNAGYVVLSTLYDSTTHTVQVGGKALSNNFVTAFYRMRDYVISTLDAGGLYPLFFENHTREGKRYKANEYILFDHIRNKIHVQKRKKFKTVDDAPPFVQDYLSTLYLIRSWRLLKPGDAFSELIYVHDTVHSITFQVKASKPKKIDLGTFSCVLLQPELVGEGRAFNKRDKLEIWLTDDRRRIPVAIRSKIKFGSIRAKLLWMNRTDGLTSRLVE